MNYEKKEINCELCGKKEIVYTSKIKNTLNQTQLTIGSTCADKFDEFKDIKGRTFKELRKDSWRYDNEMKIDEIENGTIRTLNHYSNCLARSNFIPYYISDKHSDLSLTNDKCDSVLNKKLLTPEDIDYVLSASKILNSFYDEIDEYERFNNSNLLGVNKSILDWIRKERKADLLQTLKTIGQIDHSTFRKLNERGFTLNLTKSLEYLLTEGDFYDITYDEERLKIEAKNSCSEVIKYSIDMRSFKHVYGINYFQKQDDFVSIKELANRKMLAITDPDSLWNALEKICREKLFEDYTYRLRSIINDSFALQIEQSVFVVSFSEFVNHFLYDTIEDKHPYHEMINYFISNGSVFTEDKFNQYKRGLIRD